MGKNNTFILTETSEEWGKILTDLSKKSAAVLDTVKHPIQQGAFAACVNSLRDTGQHIVDYLPAGERADLEALCGTYLALGLVFGYSPQLLVDALRKSGAKIGVMCEEGGDEK